MVSFIQAVQNRVAVVAISPSAVRNAGASGVVTAATKFMASLDLRSYAISEEKAFRKALDEGTNQLKRALPKKAQHWGLARKCLNIFLRDAFYNGYLLNEFGLAQAEQCYEIPLDSVVVVQMREKAKGAGWQPLPQWKGVKNLQQQDSDQYQEFASNWAEQCIKKPRVHLDTYLWVQGRLKKRLEIDC